jgi:alpha-methylacyl-CoA racemase
MRARLASVFKSQPRAHWQDLLQGCDACFAPVLSPAEAAQHPHNQARGIFGAQAQPMPAPRFTRSKTPLPPPPPSPADHSRQVLQEAGIPAAQIDQYFKDGTVS